MTVFFLVSFAVSQGKRKLAYHLVHDMPASLRTDLGFLMGYYATWEALPSREGEYGTIC